MAPISTHLLPRVYYYNSNCSSDSNGCSFSTTIIIIIVVILILKIIFWAWLIHRCMKRRSNAQRGTDEKWNNNGNAPSWTAAVPPPHQQQDDVANLPAYEPPRKNRSISPPSYSGHAFGRGVSSQDAPIEMQPTHVRSTSYGGAGALADQERLMGHDHARG